ncbi:hypothetical protein BJ165DRAFT_1409789 [Panaeolus papilionaceus]|nr:hypothetical protein BJ165DRAFT_1409789 [Panaeolus papilionaceus]
MMESDNDIINWNPNSLSDPASEESDSDFYSGSGSESGSDESKESTSEQGGEVEVRAQGVGHGTPMPNCVTHQPGVGHGTNGKVRQEVRGCLMVNLRVVHPMDKAGARSSWEANMVLTLR